MAITVESLYAPSGSSTPCPRCRRNPARWDGKCCHACGCSYSQHYFDLVIASNGVHQFRPVCTLCGATGDAVRHKDVSAFAAIRNTSDNRGCVHCEGTGCPVCVRTPCCRCGSCKAVEWHHWAPRALFDDANSWPQSPLCADCHRRWHAAMRSNKRSSIWDVCVPTAAEVGL